MLVKDVIYPELLAIWLLSVIMSLVKASVPLAFGNLIDLSAVGFCAIKVVSLASAVVPSNTTPLEVSITATLLVVVVPAIVKLPGMLIVSFASPNVALPNDAAKADLTLVVSVTSAEASIAFNLEWSVSVNTFESVAASTAALISAFDWSAVADASIAFNLEWSVSVNTFESDAASTALLTCALFSCVLVFVTVLVIAPVVLL